jgi:hypothetical protein
LDREAGAGLKPGRDPDHDAKARAEQPTAEQTAGAADHQTRQEDHETRYRFFPSVLKDQPPKITASKIS